MNRAFLLVDPATFFLIFLATACNFFGARRSIEFKETYKQLTSEEPEEINLRTAILLPITGSVTLILLFYFLSSLYYLMVALICLLSFVGISFLTQPIIEKYFGYRINPITCQKPILGFTSLTCSWTTSIILACLLVVSWLLTGFWFLNNVLAVAVAVTSLTLVRCSRLKIIATLLILFFIYDIFWVFFSSYLFGDNVMVSVATEKVLPNVFICPRVFDYRREDDDSGDDGGDDGGDDEDEDEGRPYALLGVGDVVLPGFLIGFTYYVDTIKRYQGFQGYFLPTMISYTLGLYSAVAIVVAMNAAQPALLYLVPFNLGTVTFLAYRRGEFLELWNGPQKQNGYLPVATTAIEGGHEEYGQGASSPEHVLSADPAQSRLA